MSVNSIERVFNCLEGEQVDRPPIFPMIGDHACFINGLSYNEMYKSAEKVAKAHLKALKLYDYDFTTIQVEPSWSVAEACGAKVLYPHDKSPWIKKHLIESEADINLLEVPDFLNTTSTYTMIKGTKILAKSVNVPVVAFMTGPLTFSLQLMPYKKFFRLMSLNKKIIHELIQKSVQIIIEYVKLLKDAGASILTICEHDIQLVSPKIAKYLSFNYLSNIFKTYEFNILHACGKVYNHLLENVDLILNMKNLKSVSIGQFLDINSVLKLFNYEIGVAGNIDHVKLLPRGTPSMIIQAVHQAINESESVPNYMVAPECEITVDTPVNNVKALVSAVKSFKKKC